MHINWDLWISVACLIGLIYWFAVVSPGENDPRCREQECDRD